MADGLVAAQQPATKANHERLDGLFERFDLGALTIDRAGLANG